MPINQPNAFVLDIAATEHLFFVDAREAALFVPPGVRDDGVHDVPHVDARSVSPRRALEREEVEHAREAARGPEVHLAVLGEPVDDHADNAVAFVGVVSAGDVGDVRDR